VLTEDLAHNLHLLKRQTIHGSRTRRKEPDRTALYKRSRTSARLPSGIAEARMTSRLEFAPAAGVKTPSTSTPLR